MTETEFINWLRGFVTACHEFTPTPKQWAELKEELKKVIPNPSYVNPLHIVYGPPKNGPYEPPYIVGDPLPNGTPWFGINHPTTGEPLDPQYTTNTTIENVTG